MRGSAVVNVASVCRPPLQLGILGWTNLVDVEVGALVLIGQVVRNTTVGTGDRFVGIDPDGVTLKVVDRRAIIRSLAHGN